MNSHPEVIDSFINKTIILHVKEPGTIDEAKLKKTLSDNQVTLKKVAKDQSVIL